MKKAFTLIEVLVSSLILVIVITGVLMTFVFCQRMIIEDTHKHNASMIINEHFEEIQRLNTTSAMTDIIIPYTASPKVIVKYLNEGQPREYRLQFRVSDVLYPIPAVPANLIEATVEWEGVTGKRDLKAELILNDTN